MRRPEVRASAWPAVDGDLEGHAIRREARAAADWIFGFLAGTYGPGGGHKLVAHGDDVHAFTSGASALREAGASHPAGRPYVEAATAVQVHVGDQAAGCAMLAAAVVRRVLDAIEDGLPLPVALDGLRLARRQAIALLEASSRPAGNEALRTVAPALGDAADVIMAGMEAEAEAGAIDLERIDIRMEPGATAAWSAGTVAEPQRGPQPAARQDTRVLWLRSWTVKPRAEGAGMRLRDVASATQASCAEARLRHDVLDAVMALDPGLVVCDGALDEGLADGLAAAGAHVWTDAPRSACERIAHATGCRPVPVAGLDTTCLGRADLVRRRGREGLLVEGPGPGATLFLPAETGTMQRAREDDAERLLRAAGAFLADPRATPGGGRWQRLVADGLRKASDAAPGTTPLAVQAVAVAFDDLADVLVRNTGADPLDVRILPDAEHVLDAWPAVRLSVTTAFATAESVLRLDGRYAKRASTTAALRGGTGPVGSPKGMPGDVPPLM